MCSATVVLAGSSRLIQVLLCDTPPAPVYDSEASMNSLQTTLETFDPARGCPGVAFGARSVVKIDYSVMVVRLALTGVTSSVVSCKQRAWW
jgi:hypothetical protein